LKNIAALVALCLISCLSGCDKAGDVILNTQVLTSEEGVWAGGFLSLGGGGGTISLAFIQDGQIITVEGDPANPCHLYAGEFNPQLAGTMTRYAGTATASTGANPSSGCPNGGPGDGTIEPSTSLSPNPANMEITMFRTLNIQVGDPRNLMVLQPLSGLYERVAAPELITGTWNYDIAGNPPYNLPLAITLNTDGTLSMSGTDTLGCSYGGTVEIRDPAHNLYHIKDMTLIESPGIQPGTGCVGYQTLGDERYSGFAAFLDNTPETSQVLALMVSSPSHAFYILMSKGA